MGLLVGRPDRPVRRVLVALDVTPAVAAEAAELGADLIVAHHPVMNVRWHEREMQTLRDDTRLGGLLTCLVRQDLSVICMHTNLDAAEGLSLIHISLYGDYLDAQLQRLRRRLDGLHRSREDADCGTLPELIAALEKKKEALS